MSELEEEKELEEEEFSLFPFFLSGKGRKFEKRHLPRDY